MPGYGFKVVFADPRYLSVAGLGKVSRVPFIFDSEPGYARIPNRFLIDRALGVWDPKGRGEKPNPQPPSRQSMKNYAHWLANALEWAEVRGVDLMMADYSELLIGRYQQEMLSGIWSSKNKPLSAETVNARVQTALDYQVWCADKGLREPFVVPRVTRFFVAGSHDNSRSHEVKSVEARKGKVRVNKLTLAFPREEEIAAWRKLIYDQPITGKTEGLIVDLILSTAIRRQEAACWRVDTLPLNSADWRIVNPEAPEENQLVAVDITYGTKGKQYGIDIHGDKIGPRGTIHVPLLLAKRLHQYRGQERLIALKPALRRGRTAEAQRRILSETVHLFINPRKGQRYTGEQIYQFWKKVEHPRHWSPHLGRDWWACMYLLNQMQDHKAMIARILGIPNLHHNHPLVLELKNTAEAVIRLQIKPQLRHTNTSTTEIYLQWLFNQFRLPLNLTQQWMEVDASADQRRQDDDN